jgi:threonyl-tRNA synthetase
MLHVDHFRSAVTEKGRSKIFEEPPSRVIEVEEALLVLTSVEKQDETQTEEVSIKAVNEISKLAHQLKVNTVVIHPFAHLFAEMSRAEVALKALKLTEEGLVRAGFKAVRTPFGWFNTLELKAKGHPLSRVARTISLEK